MQLGGTEHGVLIEAETSYQIVVENAFRSAMHRSIIANTDRLVQAALRIGIGTVWRRTW
jgi:hypothetical protein